MSSMYSIPPDLELGPVLTLEMLEKDPRRDWGQLYDDVPAQLLRTQGEGIRVGVCDTGCTEHPDVAKDRILFAKNYTGSRTEYDRNGHSTHVGGHIAADGEYRGIMPKCKIGFCKVLGDSGSGSNIAAGVEYCIEQKVHLINLSLGGGYDRGTHEAIQEANRQGIFVFCAAGNSGGRMGYPALNEESIAIGSTDKNGMISNFSSRGEKLDAVTPGSNILSNWLNGQWRSLSGTSMSCPGAVGRVGLALAATREKGLEIRNVADMRKMIKATATDIGEAGKDNKSGWGFLTVKNLVDYLADEELENSPTWWT